MRKRNLFVAVYLALGTVAAFTSCSNNDEMDQGVEQGTDNTQVLTLRVASGGEGMSTRAGRPLFSTTADQAIDYVALYFVNASNQIVLKKLADWSKAQPTLDKTGKELEIALKGDQKLKEDGLYMIYAVGYSKNSDYDFTPALPSEGDATPYATEGAETWGTFEVKLKEGKVDAEEIFAGYTDLYVINGQFEMQTSGQKNGITLHRQVAGITGYFTNIPVYVNATPTGSVRLVSVKKNKTAEFKYFNSFKYIVNGKDAVAQDGVYADGNAANIIYEIQLSDWFISPTANQFSYADCDINGDGFLGYDDVALYLEQHKDFTPSNGHYAIWKNPHYNDGVRFVRGSIFSGKFVIPFEKGEHNTLQLQILNTSGEVTKYWNINTDQVVSQEEATDLGSKWDDSKSIYNIYRNHLYSIGKKSVDNPNPTDPDKPDPDKPNPDGPDPEDPEDLSIGQDLIISVDDNWEIIHNMGIE